MATFGVRLAWPIISALPLTGRIVLLSVKNKGNRWLLKLKLRYWYTLTSKRFEICRQLLSSLTLCLCKTGVLNLDWLGLLTILTLNSSTIFVADMVIRFGRYGLFVWMMWLWPIWSVADMVQTRLCWTVFTRNRDTAVCSQPMFVCLLIFGCLWVFLAAFLCPVCVVVNVYSFPFLLFMFYLSGE